MKHFALALFLFTVSAHAFDLSLVVDANFDSSMYSRVNVPQDTEGKTGFGVGGLISFEMSKVMNFETGALMVNRKYSWGPESFGFTRLQVPAVFRITALPIVSFGAGPYVEFAMGDIAYQNSTTKEIGSRSYENRGLDSTDFGVLASVGADIPVAPLFSLTFDLRYNLGLKDIDISVTEDRKFAGFQFLAGVKLSL